MYVFTNVVTNMLVIETTSLGKTTLEAGFAKFMSSVQTYVAS